MSDDFYQSDQWMSLRYRILQKSGGCCALCGCRTAEDNPLQVDHIKPRSLHPELELAESNMQVLCRRCNLGKGNKDSRDWRWAASRELSNVISRKTLILAHATPEQKGKLEQLSWLKNNEVDLQIRREAERQYRYLWRSIEADWLVNGKLN